MTGGVIPGGLGTFYSFVRGVCNRKVIWEEIPLDECQGSDDHVKA